MKETDNSTKPTDSILIYKGTFKPVFEGTREELEKKFKNLKGKNIEQIVAWSKKQKGYSGSKR